MRGLVWQGKTDLANRDLANSIIAQVGAKDWQGEIAALFEWVRTNIRYTLDTSDIEVLQSAAVTIALGYGDCDDMAILLATLLECSGHKACFIALGFSEPGDFSHVLVLASGAGETPWIALDATEPNPVGWFPPGAICEMLAPLS